MEKLTPSHPFLAWRSTSALCVMGTCPHVEKVEPDNTVAVEMTSKRNDATNRSSERSDGDAAD